MNRFTHIIKYFKRLQMSLGQILALGIISLALTCAVPQQVAALGAPAGTTVVNVATLSYVVEGEPLQRSATTSLLIDELIDLDLSALDLTHRDVFPGETDSPLAFRLTNTGNGTETFQLSVNNFLAGDDFAPIAGTPVAIYLDDGDGNFDAALDTAYSFGGNDPTLAADAAQVIFVLNDIPAATNDGDIGSSQLTATSTTGSGAAWTVLGANTGDSSSTAVLGASGGTAQDSGSYLVTDLFLALDKSYTIVDPVGGSDPIPGAIITFRIQASVSGTGTLSNITVTDPIPANTTYVADSLTLNGTPLTDLPADDAGDFNDTNANAITVLLGDMSDITPSQTIEFQVTID